MPAIYSELITSHNRKVLEDTKPQVAPTRTCNCDNPDSCPLNGNCLVDAVVYKADVFPEELAPDSEYYVGHTEPFFKGRFNDHNTSFRYVWYKTKSKLATHVWNLKEEGKTPVIKWSILKKTTPYRAGSKKCNICLWEKYFIINGDEKMINKKDELLGKCKHRDKFLLQNYKSRNRNRIRDR